VSESTEPTQPNDAAAPTSRTPPAHQEIAVDLASFLPEGVEVGVDHDEPVEADRPESTGAGAGPADGPAGSSAGDEVDLALLSSIERDLAAVDEAIAALDAGTYGTCAVCAAPLSADLLQADPVAQRCAAHVA
jgi:RNA polymerase-binding transcription factor DksA